MIPDAPPSVPSPSAYALFLGCTVPVRALHYELSARKVAQRLGVPILDIPEFGCCGFPVKSINRYAYLLMAARNLALAEERGLSICTLCSACTGALTEALQEIGEDEKLRHRINRDLFAWTGKRYHGTLSVIHFTRLLYQKVGTKKIQAQIQRDLSEIRLAPHYGCHYTKPSHLYHRVEDPEWPVSLDELIEAAGAQSLAYEEKLRCCGGGVLAFDEPLALAMAQRKLDHIRAAGADGMVLICPFCNVMYESNQKKIEKLYHVEYKLPVLFYPQLLGLALGLSPEELGIRMNRIKPLEVLKKMERRSLSHG